MNSSFALNPFKKGNKGDIEGIRNVQRTRSSWLEETINQYNEFRTDEHLKSIDTIEDDLKNLDEIILSPGKINMFLQYVINKNLFQSEVGHYGLNVTAVTGTYITHLIQNSFSKGHNDFILDTQNYGFKFLGHKIKGDNNKKINITIIGNIGSGCGQYSVNSNFTIHGNADFGCGWYVDKSTFAVYGNTPNYFGASARNSNFFIKGNTGFGCAEESFNSCFMIKGNAGSNVGYRAYNSIIKTTRKRTYQNLKNNLAINNKIQLLDRKGNVIEEEKK